MGNALPLPPSLWVATARPAPATPPLDMSRQADVAIVGAGYSGLAAALQLAEAGASVVVLETGEPGWGASGRNGGQVIPGLKSDPDELVAMFGPEAGEHLARVAGGAPDTVFALIARHGIDCGARQCGWIQPAFAPADVGVVTRRAEQWQRRGAPVAVLDRDGVRRLVGSPIYHGGLIDRRAGCVQPLSYSRGLARAAQKAGALVCGGSRVTALVRDGGRWKVTTAHGPMVSAERVLLATNGYTDALWPRLRRTVIAANSFQVATERLSDSLRRTVLPEGHVASDTRKLLLYYRCDHRGRLIMGGRGPFREPASPHDYRHLQRMIGLLFPQLKDTRCEFYWTGRVALTRDHVPHVHQPAPGLSVFLGYNGRGVAMATTLGTLVAKNLIAPADNALPFPITRIRPIPLHSLHRIYATAILQTYRLRDYLAH
ncbi:MAG TPA: FAD-binding oxidoreductase [Casimicrobiaceae bacterium]|jgi:glycine/D-amino acid oxidase-like deaminating enzyme|nr:FAD-binding oxidoreductase [Casimicrobiaceae bacterium]